MKKSNNPKKGVSFANLNHELDEDDTLPSSNSRSLLKGSISEDSDSPMIHNVTESTIAESSESEMEGLVSREEDDIVLSPSGHAAIADEAAAASKIATLTEEIDDTGRTGKRRKRYLLSPKKLFTDLMYWMFGTSFLSILLVFMANFYLLVVFFSLLIWAIGTAQGECVIMGGSNLSLLKEPLTQFASCFALSWTTFSTVGYGNVYPATQTDFGGDENNACEPMHIILMIEAFVGVLYAGCCGAILFGKVLRIQSSAQVQFSQPIVIRFGKGLNSAEDVLGSSATNPSEESQQPTCPILEFRLINELHSTHKGEIVDASINCVVSKKMTDHNETGDDDNDDKEGTNSASMAPGPSRWKNLNFFSKRDNGPEKLKTLPRRMFSKLKLTHEEHPFFKRAWTAVHILDETSPLLNPAMRSEIRENRGWPKEKNNWRTIREHLDFYQIIVSVNGVSRMNNAHVYSQKIYDSVDVVIGYQFVHLLTKDEKDNVKLLTEYLNDVIKQRGDDEIEPITDEDNEKPEGDTGK